MKMAVTVSAIAFLAGIMWSATGSATILGSNAASSPTPAATTIHYTVAEGCAVPANLSGNTYYVDPVHGKMSNNGSAAAPWDTLQNVMAQKKSIIKGGDTINLMSGNHGTVAISNMVNSNFVTIQAASGQTPVLNRLNIYGTQKLIIKGLKIQSLKTTLATIAASSQNIIFTGNILSTQDNMAGWTQAQWIANGSSGLNIDGRPDVVDEASPIVGGVAQSHHSTHCITISNNTLTNVKLGVAMNADHSLFMGNIIDNYAWDAVDYGGNWLTLSNNKTTNINDLGDGMHDDCYQGFLPGGNGYNAATFSNVTITSNICIRQTNPNIAFPGSFQGIDNFDGGGYRDWYNLKVTNNFITTNQWNCINFGGIHDSQITNNTCVADGVKTSQFWDGETTLVAQPGNVSWITLNDYNHYSQKSNNVTVTKNIATAIQGVGATDPSNSITNNVALSQVSLYVNGIKKWYSTAGNYDGNILDPNLNSSFTSVTSISTPLGPMLVYNPTLKAGSPYIGMGVTMTVSSASSLSNSSMSSGSTNSTGAYKGTIVLKANARQDGTPSLAVLINGVQAATETVSADVHVGQVGTYTITYASATPVKTIDVKLNGYTSTEQKYVSVNLFNLLFTPSSGKETDLVRQTTGKVSAGQASFVPSGAEFFTSGSDVQYNVSNITQPSTAVHANSH